MTELQPLLDGTHERGTLTLRKGEYSGPARIDLPCTLHGNGSILWARRGPTLVVGSGDVFLRDVEIEVTAPEESDLPGKVALRVEPGVRPPTLAGVRLRGLVEGFGRECGEWFCPDSVQLPRIPVKEERHYLVRVCVPAACRAIARAASLSLTPTELPPGLSDLFITVHPLSRDTVLVGEIELRSGDTMRVIKVSIDTAAGGAPSGPGLPVLYWDPPAATSWGDVPPPPPEETIPVPSPEVVVPTADRETGLSPASADEAASVHSSQEPLARLTIAGSKGPPFTGELGGSVQFGRFPGVIGSNGPPLTGELDGARFVVGRGQDCEIVLSGTGVSLQHCEILLYGGKHIVRDLLGSNGTLVNGTRIDCPTYLEDGTEIQVGEFVLTYSHAGPSAVAVTDAPQPPCVQGAPYLADIVRSATEAAGGVHLQAASSPPTTDEGTEESAAQGDPSNGAGVESSRAPSAEVAFTCGVCGTPTRGVVILGEARCEYCEARNRMSAPDPPAPARPPGQRVRFRCGGCGKKLAVAPHLVGRKGKCPTCGASLVVPKPDSPSPPSPRVMREDPTDYDFVDENSPEQSPSDTGASPTRASSSPGMTPAEKTAARRARASPTSSSSSSPPTTNDLLLGLGCIAVVLAIAGYLVYLWLRPSAEERLARSQMADAQAALEQGDPQKAQAMLDSAEHAYPKIADETKPLRQQVGEAVERSARQEIKEATAALDQGHNQDALKLLEAAEKACPSLASEIAPLKARASTPVAQPSPPGAAAETKQGAEPGKETSSSGGHTCWIIGGIVILMLIGAANRK